MAVLTIPVKAELAKYEFSITLEGVVYILRFHWNFRTLLWYMDIASRDGTDILCGLPLLYAVNLTDRFVMETIPPGDFMVFDSTGKMEAPNYKNFGRTVQLLYFEAATA